MMHTVPGTSSRRGKRPAPAAPCGAKNELVTLLSAPLMLAGADRSPEEDALVESARVNQASKKRMALSLDMVFITLISCAP